MLEGYRWTDFIWPVALLVAFVASTPWGRKPWCMVDCCATFTFGIGMMFIPQVVLGFQITGGTLDEAHIFLARHIGALLVGSAVTWFLCRNSLDSRMHAGLIYSRIFCTSLMLIAEAYSAFHLWNRKGIHFNDKYLMFACGGVGTWMLGSIVQLLMHKEIGGYSPRAGSLGAGFWFDHFVLLLVGILFFAFPSQMLKLAIKKQKATIDGVHVCLFRCIAALTIGHALTSQSAAGFLYDYDKKCHVIGRITTQVLVFGINSFGHFVTDLFTMYNVTPLMLSGFYITFLLILYFRYNKSEVKIVERSNAADRDVKISHEMKRQLDSDEEPEDMEEEDFEGEDLEEEKEGHEKTK